MAVFLAAAFVLVSSAQAESLGVVLVRQGGMGYGYNGEKSLNVTREIETVLGNRIVVVPDFNNAAKVSTAAGQTGSIWLRGMPGCRQAKSRTSGLLSRVVAAW